MKKHLTLILTAVLAMTAVSCNKESITSAKDETADLKIKVATPTTKAIIEDAYLPDGSEIGLRLVDAGGTNYNTITYDNVKYTATGTSTEQVWGYTDGITLGSIVGTLYGYYPYSSEVTTLKEIPVTATSENQIDYMWADPVNGLDATNSEATLSMNHALTAIRLKIDKGDYTGAGVLSKITLLGNNIAQNATLNATTGELSSFANVSQLFEYNTESTTLSSTASVFDFIVVPVKDVNSKVRIMLTIDGTEYILYTSAMELEQNKIYEYTLSMKYQFVEATKVEAKAWTVINNSMNLYNTDIAYAHTPKIVHSSGALYTSEEWTAMLTASTVTNEDALGVAVPKHNDEYSYSFIVHKSEASEKLKWSSNTSVLIEDVITVSTKEKAQKDFAGAANTNAILAAVTAGTIADAPAASYCAELTTGDLEWYLPAGGEIQSMYNYMSAINTCLTACGGTSLSMTSNAYWSSTQSSSSYAWNWYSYNSYLDRNKKNYTSCVRAVSAFSF